MACFGGGKSLFLAEAMTVAADRRQEILRLPVADRAHSATTPMRPGTDAGVILVAPVSEIVPALCSRLGMI
jgi:hypothetical protein